MIAVLFLLAAACLGFASGFARRSFWWAVIVSLASGWFFAVGGVITQAGDGDLARTLTLAVADGLPVAALAFGTRLLGRLLVWAND